MNPDTIDKVKKYLSNSENSELPYTLEDVMNSHKTLSKRVDELHMERKNIDYKSMDIHKRMKIVEDKLRKMCEHNWIREPVQYSELYCSICGVFKR